MNDSKNIENQTIVLFNLDEQHYALNLSVVERVIPIVEITLLPKAPQIVMGVINFHGRIIQVVNIRKLFNLPVCPIELSDQLIIVRINEQQAAFIVDSVTGIHKLGCCEIVDTEKTLPCTDYLLGIAKVENNIVMAIDEQKVMQETHYIG